jgi:hypothetical protein
MLFGWEDAADDMYPSMQSMHVVMSPWPNRCQRLCLTRPSCFGDFEHAFKQAEPCSEQRASVLRPFLPKMLAV